MTEDPEPLVTENKCPACDEDAKERREHEKECSELCGDLMKCQECGILFDSGYGGYFIDDADVGRDAAGGTAEIFKEDVERCGNIWVGFTEDDRGPVCDHCSWKIQRRREITPFDYGYDVLRGETA